MHLRPDREREALMADPRDNPAYAALAKTIGDSVTRDEVNEFFKIAMEVGQELFLIAWKAADNLHPRSVPTLTAAMIEAAWALAAAHAERQMVVGERAGLLIGLEERLVVSADAIRRLYYPEYSRLLTQQDPNGGGQQ